MLAKLVLVLCAVLANSAAVCAAPYRVVANGTVLASGIPGVPTGGPIVFSYFFDTSAAASGATGAGGAIYDLDRWELTLEGQTSIGIAGPGSGNGNIRYSPSAPNYSVIGQNGVPPIAFSGAFGTAHLNAVVLSLTGGSPALQGGLANPISLDPSEWATTGLFFDFGSVGELQGSLDSLQFIALPEPSSAGLLGIAFSLGAISVAWRAHATPKRRRLPARWRRT